MANKKTATKQLSRNRLESPVHSLIGYTTLLVLSLVVLGLVYSLQWYIIP